MFLRFGIKNNLIWNFLLFKYYQKLIPFKIKILMKNITKCTTLLLQSVLFYIYSKIIWRANIVFISLKNGTIKIVCILFEILNFFCFVLNLFFLVLNLLFLVLILLLKILILFFQTLNLIL